MNYKLTTEQQDMVIKNHSLILYYIRKKHLPLDETYGFCAEGLCNAVVTYNKEKNCKFSRYAYVCMYHALLSYFRQYQKNLNNESLNKKIKIDDNKNPIERIDMIKDKSNYSDYSIPIAKEIYNRWILGTTKNQRRIINTYINGCNNKNTISHGDRQIMCTMRKKAISILKDMGYNAG